jgi:hypothetical protein
MAFNKSVMWAGQNTTQKKLAAKKTKVKLGAKGPHGTTTK